MSKIKKLKVYLHKDLTGILIQDDNGQLGFEYNEEWLNNPQAVAVSKSLPLRGGKFNTKECRGFFGGILPEEAKREMIAKNLGISTKNDFAMLEQIGGECAGAISFIPINKELPKAKSDYKIYQILEGKELVDLLNKLPNRPLLAGQDGVRLSLAGAQDKLAVHVNGKYISVPINGEPSTHIIKPDHNRYKGLIYNEAFCLKLGSLVGLNIPKAEIRTVEETSFLLIERYDRIIEKNKIIRIHQEDFCQALAIPSELKYQNEGGVSVKQSFELVREYSSTPVIDLQMLLDGIIFNYLVGNNDAHGKNFSFLYSPNNKVTLAPFYDILCTSLYPELSSKMAMKIGGEYDSSKVRAKHFDKLSEEANLSKSIVKEHVIDIAKNILKNLDNTGYKNSVTDAVSDKIKSRCELVLGWHN